MARMYLTISTVVVACAMLVSAVPVWESKEDIARAMIIENLADLIEQAQNERETANIQKQAQASMFLSEEQGQDKQSEVMIQNIVEMLAQLEKDELADQEADQEAAEQEVEEQIDEQEAGEQEVDEEEADEQEAGEQNVEEQVLDSSMITQEVDKEVTLQGLSTKLSELQGVLEQINERLVQEQDDQVEEKNEEVVEMEDLQSNEIVQEEEKEDQMTVQDIIAMLEEMKSSEQVEQEVDEQAEQEVDEQAEQEVDQQAEEEVEENVEQEVDVQETDREATLQGLSTQLTELQELLGKINEQLVQEQVTDEVNIEDVEMENQEMEANVQRETLLQAFIASLDQLAHEQRPPHGKK